MSLFCSSQITDAWFVGLLCLLSENAKHLHSENNSIAEQIVSYNLDGLEHVLIEADTSSYTENKKS